MPVENFQGPVVVSLQLRQLSGLEDLINSLQVSLHPPNGRLPESCGLGTVPHGSFRVLDGRWELYSSTHGGLQRAFVAEESDGMSSHPQCLHLHDQSQA